MDGLWLYHFQWLLVILYYDMPAINVGVELVQTKAHKQTLMLNVHIASLNISKGLLAKALGDDFEAWQPLAHTC